MATAQYFNIPPIFDDANTGYSSAATPLTSPSAASEKPVYHRKGRRSLRNQLRSFSNRFWLWELIGCLVSVVLFVAIVVILKLVDGYPIYDWMLWNPSSMVALLVSVMKGAIMIPIASSLGQLKWRFFSSGSDRYRKLGRFETFDDASRGVLGSISLLFALRFWWVVSLFFLFYRDVVSD